MESPTATSGASGATLSQSSATNTGDTGDADSDAEANPVGISGDFRGVVDRRTGDFVRFTRTARGATEAPEEIVDPARAVDAERDARVARGGRVTQVDLGQDDAVRKGDLLQAFEMLLQGASGREDVDSAHHTRQSE